MNWVTLLKLPATMALMAAALLLLAALWHGALCHRRLRQRRRMAAGMRAVLVLVFAAMALLSGGLGLSLRGYQRLNAESPVLTLDAHKLAPQHWALTLTHPGGRTRTLDLYGDDWRVEAVVLKWKLPTLLAGVPPLYRLDRLSGRYDDAAQEREAPRTVIAFKPAGRMDLLNLHREYPAWLPMVDTVYGSGAYLPLVDGGHYRVSLMRTGALVARPDAATARRLTQLRQGDR